MGGFDGKGRGGVGVLGGSRVEVRFVFFSLGRELD